MGDTYWKKKKEEEKNQGLTFEEYMENKKKYMKNSSELESGTNSAGLTHGEYARTKQNEGDPSDKYTVWKAQSQKLLNEYKNQKESGVYQTQEEHDDYFSRLQEQLGKAVSMRKSYSENNEEIDRLVREMSDAVEGNYKGRKYFSQWEDEDTYLQFVKAREEQEKAESALADHQNYLNSLINTYEQGDNPGMQRMTDIERMFAEAEAKVAANRERQEQEQEDTKAYYDSIRKNEDFKEKSRYVSTKMESPSLISKITGNDKWNKEQTGDEEYEYINHGAEELGKGVISSTAGKRAMEEVFPEDSARKISDEKKYAVASGMKGGETSDPYLRKGYDYLTRDEIEMYNYIYATQGETEEERKEAAQKYLDSLNLTERMTEDFKEYFQEQASEHPVKASVESVPLGMQGSMGYWDDFFRISTDKALDTNSYLNLGGNTQSAIRGQVSKDIEESVEGTWGKVGSWAYGVGMSMADFLATTAVTGGNEALALGIMGSRAAAETVIEAKERGAKDVNAFWAGTAAGVFEMLFEKVSLEQLQMFKQQGADSLYGLIKNVMKGSFTEGSEEILTTFADTLADCVINGDLSEMSTKIREYMRAGYSEEEAVKMAQEDFAKQLALDFLGGAASGGIMSAGATGLGMIQNRNAQTSDAKTQEQTENIQEQQEEALPETKEITQEPETQENNRYEGPNVELDIPEMQQEPGVEPARQVVKSRTNEESIMDTVLTNGKVTDNIANEIVKNEGLKAEMERRTGIRLTGTESEQRNSVKAIAQVFAETHPAGMELQEGKEEDGTGANRTQKAANATVNGRQVRIIGVTKKNGNLGGLEGSDGRIYNAEDVEFSDSTTGELFQAAQTVADGNSEELSNSFLRNYRESVPVAMYARAYDLFYGAGRNGVSLPDAMKAADMFVQAAGEQAVRDAWQYGQEERVRSNKESLVEKKTAEKKGTGTYKDETKLDGPMRELQKMVAEKTGIDITRQMELEYDANGKFVPSMMSMVISSHASNEYTAMIHELGEFGLAYDRAGMKAVQDTLVKWWATKNGAEGLDSLDTILNEYQRRYAKVEGSKTRAQALDEITNDALGGLFSSESGVDDFVNWLQEDSGLSQKKQKGILQSMADLLKDLIDALKKMVKDSRLSKAARTAIQMEEQQAQEIRKRFLEVLDRASEKAQATGEYITEGKVKFALKGTDENGIEIYETSDEVQSMTKKERQARLRDLMLNEFRGRTAKFEKNGQVYYALFNKSAINKGIQGDKKSDRRGYKAKINIGADGNYVELAENALYDRSSEETGKSNKFHSDAKVWDYYVKTIACDGAYYDVLINVKDTGDSQYVYDITLHEKKQDSTRALKHLDIGAAASTNNVSSEEQEVNKRFSLKEPVEETKELIALHNLNEDKLRKTLELGGFPMPSIAVTKANIGHSNFGDITMVFGKETIDPKNKKNKVYGADAWTPTFPQTEYEADEKTARNVTDKIYEWSEDLADTYKNQARALVSGLAYNLDNYGGVEGLVERAKRNDGMKAAYLASQGQKVEVKSMEVRKEMSEAQKAMSKKILDAFGEEIADIEGKSGKEIFEKYGYRIKKAMVERLQEQGMDMEQAETMVDALNKFKIVGVVREASRFKKTGGVEVSTDIDWNGMKKDMDSRINNKEYEGWLRELFKGIVKDEGIYNGKDRFTQSGSRKSFKQTHYPVTAENIVKAMLAQSDDVRNVAGFNGVKSIRAVATEDFKSIKQIKEASGKLENIDSDTYERNLEEISNRLNTVMLDIASEKSGNIYVNMDTVGYGILEACGNPTKENVKKILTGRQWRVSDIQAQEIADIIQAVREMPVNMFEAKPQRVVNFSEVRAVVMPENRDLEEKLYEAGIENILTYDGTEEDRIAKVNSVEDVKFSLPEYDSETENQNLLKENEKYKSLVKDLQTQLALDDQQKVQISIEGVNRIVTQIYRDYRSAYDQNTFRKKLSAFFSDVASGKTESRENFLYLAEELLRPVIKESKSNLEISDYAKQVLGDIKGVKITLDAQQKAETAYAYGSYNNFRKTNFGRINLGNDGIKLDSIWQEWAEKYPNLFDADINSVDQPNALADIVASLKEDYVNDYGFDLNDAVSMAALELLESYESLPEVRRLSGGKTDVNLKAKYRQLIDEIKKEYQVKYENQLKEVRKENQEKLKKARKEDWERLQRMSQRTTVQLERQRAKFNERAKKTREQRLEMEARNKYKARIEKNTNTLIGWFNRNSDKNHIPESMKKPTMEFITSLDFLSSRAMEDSKATIELQLKMSNLTTKIATLDDGDADFMSSIDPDLTKVMQDFQEEMKGTKISDMNSRQLRDLDFIMQSLKRSITTANKLFQNQAYEDVERAGNATIEKLKDKKAKKELKGILGTGDRLLNTDMLDAGAYFRRLGPAAMSVYQEIRNGFNKRVWKLEQAQKYMKGLLKEKNISDWTGDRAKIHTFNLQGREVQLTTAQIMNLYLLAKRPQAFNHLVAEGGGFSISQKGKANGQKLTERPVKLTVGEIRVITKELSQEQKAVADAMQRFLADECSKWGNEVSMEMYGYKKFGERTYWPIKTNDNYGRTNDSNSGDNSSLYAIRNQGMTKELVKNASNPIMVGDVFDVFTEHVCNMANYNAFAIPLSDAMKWYNYRMRSEDGIVISTTKEEIDRAYGSEAKRYFLNLMKDINGEVTKGYGSEISDTLTGKYKAAAVGANLRVVVQQPTAYFRAAAVMDPKYLVKAAGMKPAIKECQENSAIAKWKSWGYFETSIGTSMKKVLTGQSTMIEKVTEKSMTAAQWADDFTWGVLWNAVKEEVKDKNPGMDTASGEYMELVRTRFDEVVDQTQVVDTVLHRSQIMRSSNGAVKMAVAFMAEPTKSYNLMHTAAEEMIEEGEKDKTSVEYKEKRERVARVTTAYAVTAVIASLAASAVDAFRDDDEDKDWLEKYMEAFWANVADNVNPASQIPYVKDIWSMIQGYDSARMDTAGISTLITAVQQAYKYCTGASNKTMYGIVKGIVRGLSQVLGVPAYNVMREIESVYNTIAKEPISTTKLTGKQACKRLYSASLEEDTALQKKYLEFLSEEYDKKIEEGKTEKEARAAIMSTVTSYFKPIYQEASTSEKIKIKNTVLKIGAGGKQLYKDYNWSNWDKEE